MLFRDCFTVSTPVHMENAQPVWNGDSTALWLRSQQDCVACLKLLEWKWCGQQVAGKRDRLSPGAGRWYAYPRSMQLGQSHDHNRGGGQARGGTTTSHNTDTIVELWLLEKTSSHVFDAMLFNITFNIIISKYPKFGLGVVTTLAWDLKQNHHIDYFTVWLFHSTTMLCHILI